jgi:cation diffusion facilitator CzcD-associated flavoprotein CzcO
MVMSQSLVTQRRPIEAITDSDTVSGWLGRLQFALTQKDAKAAVGLFADDSHWRDLLAFTWNITPHSGPTAIAEGLVMNNARVHAREIALAADRTPPRRLKRLGEDVIEAIFEFETDTGRCHGVVRLLQARPDKAVALMTSLEELKGAERPIDARRPAGSAFSRNFGGANWSDMRRAEQAFEDRDPAVLIIGAGQAGLSGAARLKLLGVDALVVDRFSRVGDVWRERYHSLALHNGVQLNHLAHMPFPPNWPNFLPKDMLANWLEAYALALQCNVWTSTTFVEGSFDAVENRWTARVRRADDSERVLRPRHLVFANGVSGKPKRPKLPGVDTFKGVVMHSHDYRTGEAWRDKRALVLGAGTSGHDVAQDLHGHGAIVRLVQRGSTTVVNVNSAKLVHTVYYDENLPLRDADLIATMSTYPMLIRGYQGAVKRMAEMDEELLMGLTLRGFKHDFGEDQTGHQMKFRRRGGGYYLNCGCSDLIVSGEIGLIQHENIDQFVADGALMKDGRTEKADLIVMASGYESQQELVRQLLGSEIADKVGPIWGIAADGELANMFRPTAQKGLWFTGGGLAHARIYSHYLALQIKAREAGLVH